MYKDMKFVDQIKSNLVRHQNAQVKSYIIMMCKITLDHYKEWPVKCTRWMDFEVPLSLQQYIGTDISIEIDEKMELNVMMKRK
jgi:hypothetical protein